MDFNLPLQICSRFLDKLLCFRKLVALLLIASVLSACVQVKPWQRGHLAREDMQGDPDPLTAKMNNHTYTSKEGSSGGVSAQGGGCGCN